MLQCFVLLSVSPFLTDNSQTIETFSEKARLFMKTFLNKEYQNISIASNESNTPMHNYGDQLPLKLSLINVTDFIYAKHISSIFTFYYTIF